MKINILKQEEMGLFYFYVFKRLAYYTFVYTTFDSLEFFSTIGIDLISFLQ